MLTAKCAAKSFLSIPVNLLNSAKMLPLASLLLSPKVHCTWHSIYEFVEAFLEFEHSILKTGDHTFRAKVEPVH